MNLLDMYNMAQLYGMDSVESTKRNIIDKVCKWLKDNLYNTCDALGNTGIDSYKYGSVEDLIEGFKNDML